VDESTVILLFLSRGYFCSRNCLREIKAAKARDKPLLLVLETNETKGGLTLEEAREECPEELREYVFGPEGSGRGVIPWHRITVFQLCTLKEIVREMLTQTPLYASEPNLTVYLDSDIDIEMLKFPKPLLLYASPNNPGCAAAAKELTVHFSEADLKLVQEAPHELLGGGKHGPPPVGTENVAGDPVDAEVIDLEMPPSRDAIEENGAAVAAGEPLPQKPSLQELSKATAGTGAGPSRLSLDSASETSVAAISARPSHIALRRRTSEKIDRSLRQQVFLLYLNSQTFVGELGVILAVEVRRALENKANILLLHENDRQKEGCDFSHFFNTTPREFIDAGLYKPIALGLYPAPHRDVSLALVAQALGATKKSGISWSSHDTAKAQGEQQASGNESDGKWVGRLAISVGRRIGMSAAAGAAPPEQPPSGRAQDVESI
jgi:hypothetical protein